MSNSRNGKQQIGSNQNAKPGQLNGTTNPPLHKNDKEKKRKEEIVKRVMRKLSLLVVSTMRTCLTRLLHFFVNSLLATKSSQWKIL